jgi:hypothetical protein
MLAAREKECGDLRTENSDLVMRLLQGKASMQDEMNKMNDLVDKLSAQNAEFKAAEVATTTGKGEGA